MNSSLFLSFHRKTDIINKKKKKTRLYIIHHVKHIWNLKKKKKKFNAILESAPVINRIPFNYVALFTYLKRVAFNRAPFIRRFPFQRKGNHGCWNALRYFAVSLNCRLIFEASLFKREKKLDNEETFVTDSLFASAIDRLLECVNHVLTTHSSWRTGKRPSNNFQKCTTLLFFHSSPEIATLPILLYDSSFDSERKNKRNVVFL